MVIKLTTVRFTSLIIKKTALVYWGLVFMLVSSTYEANAVNKKNHKLISSVAPVQFDSSMETTVDGQEFIGDMKTSADSYNSYSFVYEMTVYKGKKQIQEKGNFYFKKPRLVRVEEVGDYKKGSVAVIGKDGKIRGHMGGPLNAFVITLKEDSDNLLSANGYSFVNSDFSSMAQVMTDFVKRKDIQSKLSERPVPVDGLSNKVYVLELYKGPGNSQLFKRIFVDPKTLLPVEWFDYNNGQLFARTLWKNLQLNTNIKDDIFTL